MRNNDNNTKACEMSLCVWLHKDADWMESDHMWWDLCLTDTLQIVYKIALQIRNLATARNTEV
jgi:hypothetical protein